MIQVTPQVRILVAREPIDFRKGIDGTAAVCRQVLEDDPMGGKMFIFRNRARTMVRVIVYDGQGYWLMTKRMSAGRFRHWLDDDSSVGEAVDPHQLHVLLAGGDWKSTSAAKYWRKVA
jgi:transposase